LKSERARQHLKKAAPHTVQSSQEIILISAVAAGPDLKIPPSAGNYHARFDLV
jgi:hypothetical protein